MNEDMVKSLVALIDESLAELEELKKSDRFSAAEVKLDGPGQGIAGKDPQGSLGKEEGVNEEEEKEVAKAEDEEEEEKEDEDEEEEEEAEEKKEEAKKEAAPMKKSKTETAEALMKSYVDARLSPIESKIETIIRMVQQMADAPVPAKSASYKSLAPLKKSADTDVEPMTKSLVVDKLFDLKKSGQRVDSADIARAEMASDADLAKIASKYGIK